MNTNSLRLAAMASIIAVPSLGLACPPDSEESGGQARFPIALSAFGDGAKSQTVKVEINNDDVRAWVNGEEVDAGRIRREEGRIVILDEDGREIQDVIVNVEDGEHGVWAMRMNELFPEGNAAWETALAAAEGGPPPTVMLGIMMDVPGPALVRQLGLEEGATTLITAVHEGLPAHEAGLAEFDIIVKVDGESPADPARIKEVLSGKNPGDTVMFKVVSGGDDRDVRVTVAAYDAAKMESATILGSAAGTSPLLMELRRALDAAGVNDKELHEKLQKELLIAPEARMFRVSPPMGGGGMQDVIIERRHMDAALEERLAELDDRLARLEEMLEQLMADQGAGE